jgi:hypothetical protein
LRYCSSPPLQEKCCIDWRRLPDHVLVIPYLDGSAHIAFILKHPAYAARREYPESSYQLCVTSPGTY